jgi:hypothetical protein
MCAVGDQRTRNVVRPALEHGRLSRPKAESGLFCIERCKQGEAGRASSRAQDMHVIKAIGAEAQIATAECATPQSDLDIVCG